MIDTLKAAFEGRPSWSIISMVLLFGVGLVGFGNGDRLLWNLTSNGANLSGIVVDVRSYRRAEDTFVTFVPKVAFRNEDGAIYVREVSEGSRRFDLEVDQPVYVLWDKEKGTVAIDVPFKRQFMTSMILNLLTALGITAWVCGICLIGRRLVHRISRMGETA